MEPEHTRTSLSDRANFESQLFPCNGLKWFKVGRYRDLTYSEAYEIIFKEEGCTFAKEIANRTFTVSGLRRIRALNKGYYDRAREFIDDAFRKHAADLEALAGDKVEPPKEEPPSPEKIKEIAQRVAFEEQEILQALREGFGGMLPNGNIVDRRKHPEAMPLQQSTPLGTPSPQPVEGGGEIEPKVVPLAEVLVFEPDRYKSGTLGVDLAAIEDLDTSRHYHPAMSDRRAQLPPWARDRLTHRERSRLLSLFHARIESEKEWDAICQQPDPIGYGNNRDAVDLA